MKTENGERKWWEVKGGLVKHREDPPTKDDQLMQMVRVPGVLNGDLLVNLCGGRVQIEIRGGHAVGVHIHQKGGESDFIETNKIDEIGRIVDMLQ